MVCKKLRSQVEVDRVRAAVELVKLGDSNGIDLIHQSIDQQTDQDLGIKEIPEAMKVQIGSILMDQDRRTQKEEEAKRDALRRKIELLTEMETICLKCESIQRPGAWNERMDAISKTAGQAGFINISAKERCLNCDSDDMAGPRWQFCLLRDADLAYTAKMRAMGVKASWLPNEVDSTSGSHPGTPISDRQIEQLRGLLQIGMHLSDGDIEEIVKSIGRGELINSIQLLRARTPIQIKEGKAAVEKLKSFIHSDEYTQT